jgi:hypothetical protein
MAAANTRRIVDIRQFNPSPENEVHVTYSDPGPGEAGPSGKKRYGAATVLLDLARDFQDLAKKYEQLEKEVEELRAHRVDTNPLTPPPPPPVHNGEGAILKQPGDALSEHYNECIHDEHGPAQPMAVRNYFASNGG